MEREYGAISRDTDTTARDLDSSFFDGDAWVGYRTWVKLVREAWDTHEPYSVRGPGDIHRAFKGLADCDRERFYSVQLDGRHQVCGIELVTQGVMDASLIHPRELYKTAILANAASLILVHNHPSGDPHPSPEDRAVTRQLVDAGKVIGIPVLDHVIIGKDKYVSLSEEGLL